jgi:hypothetical protein
MSTGIVRTNAEIITEALGHFLNTHDMITVSKDQQSET